MNFVSDQCMLNDKISQGVQYYCHITLHEDYRYLHQVWNSLHAAMYTVSVTGQATALRGTESAYVWPQLLPPNYGLLLLCWHHRYHFLESNTTEKVPCEDTFDIKVFFTLPVLWYMDNCIVAHNTYCHNCNIVYTYNESNLVDDIWIMPSSFNISNWFFHSESIFIHPSLWVRMWQLCFCWTYFIWPRFANVG